MSENTASGVCESFIDSTPMTKLIIIALSQGDTEADIALAFGINKKKISKILNTFRINIGDVH